MPDSIFGILGGGIAGLSLASFLRGSTTVLEAEGDVGGLSRSYSIDGINYDIGPHAIFSKNEEVLNLHKNMTVMNKLRRSNQILIDNSYIQFPFENNLGSLPKVIRDKCLNDFLNNPYEDKNANNMLQFFLKTFGEGITYKYLEPYNRKIWKYDPSYLDLQMVERIPKPPKEDVVASVQGKSREGYKHQLHFYYPSTGGFQSLVHKYERIASQNGPVRVNQKVQEIIVGDGEFEVITDSDQFTFEKIINTMPLHELEKVMNFPNKIRGAIKKLKYNSIHIIALSLKHNNVGDHFAIYVPDPDIIFHRFSKLCFLGDEYARPGDETTIIAEVTFRDGDNISLMSERELVESVISGLVKLGMCSELDILSYDVRTQKYAYVIYDLDHRKHTDIVLRYLQKVGIESVGRFAEFEYLNTDAVVENTLKLARYLNGSSEIDFAKFYA